MAAARTLRTVDRGGKSMALIVQKFGGSSVANRERLFNVARIVANTHNEGNDVVVVVSAQGDTTDDLIAKAAEITHSPSQREMDMLLATGEQISIALLAMALGELGCPAISLTGWQAGFHTNRTHTKARIRRMEAERIENELAKNRVVVVAGFQGINRQDDITTLGRGGSDTSAVALAAALGSVECEIYTDVDGVYTTDPNICSSARKMDRVAYEEMLEMASMGAKVLHIRSVEFAKKYKVPVRVRSTFSDDPGTLVTQEDSSMEAVLVSGIAYDKDQARVTLHDLPDVPGVAAAIFGPLSEKGVLVDMIVQNTSLDGHTDMTFTISRKDLKQTLAIMDEVKERTGATDVVSDVNVAKVSAIGVGMRNHSGVAARAFSALTQEGINILMISTSEIKITILIQEKYVELAVRILHDTFGLDWDIN